MASFHKSSVNKLLFCHIGTINPGIILGMFAFNFDLDIVLIWNFALFPEIVLNSFIKITTRYCYILLLLSQDQISLLCLIQTFKTSSYQNTKLAHICEAPNFVLIVPICDKFPYIWKRKKHNWRTLKFYFPNL